MRPKMKEFENSILDVILEEKISKMLSKYLNSEIKVINNKKCRTKLKKKSMVNF